MIFKGKNQLGLNRKIEKTSLKSVICNIKNCNLLIFFEKPTPPPRRKKSKKSLSHGRKDL